MRDTEIIEQNVRSAMQELHTEQLRTQELDKSICKKIHSYILSASFPSFQEHYAWAWKVIKSTERSDSEFNEIMAEARQAVIEKYS